MALAPLAVAVLVYITPHGMILDQKVSEAMPAVTCEKTLSHPAVRETYDNMTDLKGREMMLICMPIRY
jgi:aromatic ring-opening dioxygenase LigB subunit